ncbi:sodium:proton antiporter [Salinibacterium sp. ZJ450]|uniref:cation:proton antiporter n=1 Tax=Salinibacterium sp. ZJ450 TaxID=2708338 RepID=UPI00141F0284|nr:sodium:proton antiporter [Salinibacterium sp. ZJ450]
MDVVVPIVAAVLLIVGFSTVAKRLGVAAPLVLLIVGAGISYLPGVPHIEVPHEIILIGMLPPILYSAALTVPVMDFRRNLGSISSLSVFLVIASAFTTGFVLHLLLPELNFALAVAVGAVISPPDAVAAVSIGKKLALPPRLLTVMEGEGLVNDATALVLLRSAIAVAAGGVATVWEGVMDFGYAVVVAVAVGLLVGFLTVWVRSRLTDTLADNAVSLLVPFMAFIPAESLHASGVLAVVIAGIYVGHQSPRYVRAQPRMSERINWRTVQFVLENGVFLIMGLELRALVDDIGPTELSGRSAVGIGLILTAVLIVLRMLWVNPMIVVLRYSAKRAEHRVYRLHLALASMEENDSDPRRKRRRARLQHVYARRRADLESHRTEGLDWRGGLVLSWSGMRGVVTLAAAQSLPDDTLYRSQLILIAFTVAVVTLVLQGGTLPWLIRLLGIQGADPRKDRQQLAALLESISTQGLRVLDHPHDLLGKDTTVDPTIVDRVRHDTTMRTAAAWERANAEGPDVGAPHLQYLMLHEAVVHAEYKALLRARSSGRYPSRVLTTAQTILELEEARLAPRHPGQVGGH